MKLESKQQLDARRDVRHTTWLYFRVADVSVDKVIHLLLYLTARASSSCREGGDISLDISACWYNSSTASGPEGAVPSGAYIFRPDGPCYNSTPSFVRASESPVLFQMEHVRCTFPYFMPWLLLLRGCVYPSDINPLVWQAWLIMVHGKFSIPLASSPCDGKVL